MGEGLLKIMRRGSTTKAYYLTVPPAKVLWIIRLKKLRGGISFDNVAASMAQGSKTQSFRHLGVLSVFSLISSKALLEARIAIDSHRLQSSLTATNTSAHNWRANNQELPEAKTRTKVLELGPRD